MTTKEGAATWKVNLPRTDYSPWLAAEGSSFRFTGTAGSSTAAPANDAPEDQKSRQPSHLHRNPNLLYSKLYTGTNKSAADPTSPPPPPTPARAPEARRAADRRRIRKIAL